MDNPLARYFEKNGNRGAQLALAKAIGVTEATVSRYVSGKRKPPVEEALRIEKAIGVKASTWPHLRSLMNVLRRREQAA